jgi:hypothetical protein
MALDDRFKVGINLGEYFVDKITGEPLAGGTISFFEDNSRTTGKLAYQLTGLPLNYTYAPLPNPLTLSSTGTPVDNNGNNIAIYFFPFEGLPADNSEVVQNYFIQVKDSGGNEQFTREAWPNLVQDEVDDETQGKVTNELENPQFVDVFFNPKLEHVYQMTASSNTFPIGPGWDLVVTGAALQTVTVSRISLLGNFVLPNSPVGAQDINAPYALQFDPTAGITSMKLRQRLTHNPGLWSSGRISGYMTAKSEGGSTSTITLEYDESAGGGTDVIASQTNLSNTSYEEIAGNIAFPASTNSDSSDVGFLDIIVSIPVGVVIRLSSIQVVGMDSSDAVAPFDQQPVNRQQALTFNTYKDSILIQPKDSIVTGWDFGLNPWQFRSPTLSTLSAGPNAATYTADQTIIVNETANSLQVGRSTGADGASFLIKPVPATTQGKFAFVQFIDAASVLPYWGQFLSVLARGLLTTTATPASRIRFKLDLIYNPGAPTPLAGNLATNPILSFGTLTTPANYTDGWVRIPASVDNVYDFETSTSSGAPNLYPAYAFDKFELPLASAGSFLGVVLYTIDPLVDDNDEIRISDISLVANEFAIDANPKTFDQTLQECQFYYETSKNSGAIVTDTNGFGPLMRVCRTSQVGVNTSVFPLTFQIEYNTIKNKNPVINIYNSVGTVNAADFQVFNTGFSSPFPNSFVFSASYVPLLISEKSCWFREANANALGAAITPQIGIGAPFNQGLIRFQFEADARL